MANPLTPSIIEKVNPITFITEGDTVIGLHVECSVGYTDGSWSLGVQKPFDVWPDLTVGQKNQLQLIYNKIKTVATQKYIGG